MVEKLSLDGSSTDVASGEQTFFHYVTSVVQLLMVLVHNYSDAQ